MKSNPHPINRLYPYQNTREDGPYLLLRDGKEILTGTEGECWTWIHSHTPFSVDHALRYEGYSIRVTSVSR